MMSVQQRMSDLLFNQTAVVVVVVDVVEKIWVRTRLALSHLRRSKQTRMGEGERSRLSSPNRSQFTVSGRRRIVGGGGGQIPSALIQQ